MAGRKVFLGGLHFNSTNESVRNALIRYGEVKEAFVLRTMDGTSRGCGFVVFGDPDVARKLVNQQYVMIDTRKVEFKMAVPEDEMRTGGPPAPSAPSAERTD